MPPTAGATPLLLQQSWSAISVSAGSARSRVFNARMSSGSRVLSITTIKPRRWQGASRRRNQLTAGEAPDRSANATNVGHLERSNVRATSDRDLAPDVVAVHDAGAPVVHLDQCGVRRQTPATRKSHPRAPASARDILDICYLHRARRGVSYAPRNVRCPRA